MYVQRIIFRSMWLLILAVIRSNSNCSIKLQILYTVWDGLNTRNRKMMLTGLSDEVQWKHMELDTGVVKERHYDLEL